MLVIFAPSLTQLPLESPSLGLASIATGNGFARIQCVLWHRAIVSACLPLRIVEPLACRGIKITIILTSWRVEIAEITREMYHQSYKSKYFLKLIEQDDNYRLRDVVLG